MGNDDVDYFEEMTSSEIGELFFGKKIKFDPNYAFLPEARCLV